MIRFAQFSFVLAATLAAAGPARAMELPAEVTEGMYVTLDDIRANSQATFEAFAGPGGAPIPREVFVSRELPADVMPKKPDRQVLEKLFNTLDVNGDGRLTRSEWNARLERDLQFADQNEDGRVTVKELANARENMGFGDALGMIL